VEQSRFWRALALKHGLDPDNTPVEDILLLEEDKDGKLIVADKLDRALKALTLQIGQNVRKNNHK
jgi:hypothetical protein